MVIGFNWGRSMGGYLGYQAAIENFPAVDADFVPLVGGSESLDVTSCKYNLLQGCKCISS